MAKTKGSNPPNTELIYEDAGGVLHYFGEFIRGLFNEGYVSASDPETDITGKSSSGRRPSQQGEGSTGQSHIRQIFRDCSALWNSLPESCPIPLTDPPPTSKESVWAVKLKEGVVCSYYDLFMRCCINWGLSHGGFMPDGDCFPCESPCDCAGILIEYTTQSMQVNEEQELFVSNPVAGCTYLWEIESGGGSLSSGTGVSVTYTAPASNADCDQNVSIILSVGSQQCDSLQIAINGFTGTNVAYTILTCIYDRYCRIIGRFVQCTTSVHWNKYRCDGVYLAADVCYSISRTGGYPYWVCPDICEGTPPILTCEEGAVLNSCGDIGTVTDLRTPLMITQGCCPGPLL